MVDDSGGGGGESRGSCTKASSRGRGADGGGHGHAEAGGAEELGEEQRYYVSCDRVSLSRDGDLCA